MPSVWTTCANAELVFAGSGTSMIPGIQADERVRFWGPYETLSEVANLATVSVLPLVTAGGVRTRVFEFLASGVPVVATPAAVAGLALTNSECAVESDWPSFARRIVELLQRSDARRSMRESGHEFLRRVADPDLVANEWDAALRASMVGMRPRRGPS
jgi:glycosyltransferase involved in cell wall biosynthesis